MTVKFWDTLNQDYIAYFYYNEGNEKMTDKKFWTVRGITFNTLEKAEKYAKQTANQTKSDVVIMEAVATATFPTPDIEIVKLTSSSEDK